MTINWDFWEDVPEDVGSALAHIAGFCNQHDWSFELIWGGDEWKAVITTETEEENGYTDTIELEGYNESIVTAIRYVIESAKVYYDEGTY